MGWVLRTFDCADCGANTTRKVKNGKTWRCRDCGERRAIAGAVDMASKSGHMYDRWQQTAPADLRVQVEEWAATRFL
jgi:DNA-directed RNA polymerase subunit RPC12/RpoP